MTIVKKTEKRPLRFFTMLQKTIKKKFFNKKLEIHFWEYKVIGKVKHIKMTQNSILMSDLESLMNFL